MRCKAQGTSNAPSFMSFWTGLLLRVKDLDSLNYNDDTPTFDDDGAFDNVVINDDDGYVFTVAACCMDDVDILFLFVTPTLAILLLSFTYIYFTIG